MAPMVAGTFAEPEHLMKIRSRSGRKSVSSKMKPGPPGLSF